MATRTGGERVGGQRRRKEPKRTPERPARGRASKKVRYGVVGLGWFAQVAILPAFAHAGRNSELVALFSDDAEKLRKLGRKYRIDRERLYAYDRYDEVLRSGEIDAVYIAVPNHLHRDYTIRAARAGVHVLCEKPMAVTEKDCEAMIRACANNGVKLMIAYRLHFERANLEAVALVQSGRLGEPRIYNSIFCNDVQDLDNIRLNPIDEGGGTLYDIGIYCLNAARSLFRSEPEEVLAISARNDDPRFKKIDEMTSAVMKFPGNRLATFTSSFGAASSHHYDVFGTKGSLRVEPAFEFAEGMTHRVKIGEKTREKEFQERDQIAPEILTFSECVTTGRDPEPSGREGLADVRVIRALYRSAKTGRPVKLPPFAKPVRPGFEQEVHRPPVGHQKLIEVDAPSGER
ncbi:MAG: Gfo/Idh/MocA family oxidoreductase [Acidobacteriota bacterium]